MSDQATPPEGPEFSQGVPLAAIGEETLLLGHVGDAPVLLARVDQQLVAVDALCSHYHAPLAQGLRVGHALYCPWHHACFDLRNGQALKAPALSALSCWKVEQVGDTVFVRERLPPLAPTPLALTEPRRIVIVGAGAAGFAAAQRLRELGYTGELTLLGDEPDAPYDRPNVSKDYLAGQAPADWMPLKPLAFYAQQQITLLRGVRATSVDATTRRLGLSDGRDLSYDRLLLATGGQPMRPSGEDFQRPNVHLLHDLRDAEALIGALGEARSVAILGAGFIGLEAAASLRQRGVAVQVIARERLPLASRFGEAIGSLVTALHRQHGVQFQLGRSVAGYDGQRLRLDDGSELEAAILLLGLGVRPRLELAQQAGLTLDRGVLVSDCMQSSDPAIYAAGDIARYPHPLGGAPIRVEHWVVAQRQGQVAAAHMLGQPQPLREPPFFWSAHYQLTLSYVGHAEQWDRIEAEGSLSAHDAELRYFRQDQLQAVLTLNRDLASLRAGEQLRQQALARSTL